MYNVFHSIFVRYLLRSVFHPWFTSNKANFKVVYQHTSQLYLKFLCHLGEEPRWKMSQWLPIKVTLTIVTLFICSNAVQRPIEAGGKQTALWHAICKELFYCAKNIMRQVPGTGIGIHQNSDSLVFAVIAVILWMTYQIEIFDDVISSEVGTVEQIVDSKSDSTKWARVLYD